MMNRAGLSALLGGAPRHGGLAHLARGETVLPSRALTMDPSLRRHAMASMARQGRDPMRYTVGAGSMRNPASGLSQFADLIYTDQGYVDAATGMPADFSGSGYADTGYTAPAAGTSKYYPGLPVVDDGYTAPTGGKTYPFVETPAYTAPTGPKIYPGPSVPAVEQAVTPVPQPEAQQVQQQPQTYDEWAAPNTYEAWRNTRNPQGKGFQDQLYGQAVGAGAGMAIDPQQQLAPNVLGTQIPVPMQTQWSTPGTALGFASDNTSDTPSILNSGYQQAVMMPYGSGAGAGWGAPGGGIGGAGIGQQNGQRAAGSRQPPNFQAAFQY